MEELGKLDSNKVLDVISTLDDQEQVKLVRLLRTALHPSAQRELSERTSRGF